MPSDADSRLERQNLIRAILRDQVVTRQAGLVALLRNHGVDATQSSVSRDLKQLGAIKQGRRYLIPRVPQPAAGSDVRRVADMVRDVQTAGDHLTVVRTAVGAAQRVAVYLDRSGWPEIVGTVSGDDTIFVATRSAGRQRQLIAKLTALTDG